MDESPRRIPVVVYPGVLFIVVAFMTRDVWALFAGGALLALASLQWGRKPG